MWHAYLVLFTLLVGTNALLSFALGRIVDIVAQSSLDFKNVEEVPILGDLTDEDIKESGYPDLDHPVRAPLFPFCNNLLH